MKEQNFCMKKNSYYLEVVYSSRNISLKFNFILEAEITISALISKHGNLLKKYIKIEKKRLEFGVFGEKKNIQYKIKNGDRVEIYRKLLVDPIVRRKNLLNRKNF